MPKQYAAVLVEVIQAEAATRTNDSDRLAAPRENLQKILKRVSRAQQRELRWRIVPYNVTSDGEFITATANLEGLPWILLDLRGRLQPFVLRIGVGIGELSGHFQQPAKNLTGECISFAGDALGSLRAEHLLALESRRIRPRERQDARGNSLSGDFVQARLPLTRFRTNNFDFDGAVNEICKLQDSLIHQMRASEWSAFVPNSRLAKTPASRRTERRADAFRPRRESIHGLDGLRAPEPLRTFRRAYFAQLMAAAAGVQHLITERFLAHRA